MFWATLAHLQEHFFDCIYSFWCNTLILLLTGDLVTCQQQYRCIVPKAVYVTVEAQRLIKPRVLPVNPSTYLSEVVKVRKMLGNASISGFYQTMSVNAGICRHVLVKVRFVWL